MKKLVTLVAAAEAATGALALADPNILVRLLFGTEAAGAGVVIGRFAGVCLISLGVACWPGSDVLPAARGLFFYGVLATAFLAIAGMRGMAGPLLWPVVAIHAMLTILFARALFRRGTTSIS